MCGIIAYLRRLPVSAGQDGAFERLYQGLLQVQNRGYDSAGVASIRVASEKGNERELITSKYASQYQTSALELLKASASDYKGCQIGIAHTRWATHGGKTDKNAHPHIDYFGDFALVHNGIIENYLELKQFLKDKGISFQSETDSEVIVNLISYYYSCQDAPKNIELAINQAIGSLHGTWALAILCKHTPSTLYLCKNGSPLLLGFSEDEVMVASEVAGFCNVVKQYIILANHDVISVNFQNLGYIERYHVHDIGEQKLDLNPDPYPHWMIKEIEEQPQSIMRALNMGGRIESDILVKLGGLDKIADRLSKVENLVILACGTSYHAGLFGSHWIRKLQCFNTVTVIDASEFQLSDLPHSNVGVVLISQSGETKDVHRAMDLIREKDVVMIGVVNVVDSLIARESDCGVYLNCGREVAVGSTKSFTSQCLVMVLIGMWFAQQRDLNERKRSNLIQSLSSLSLCCQTVSSQFDLQCKEIAQILAESSHNSCFILGRGSLYAIALEGALKLKEIGYCHAEGFSGGSLKHGPFALLEVGLPVILLSDVETRSLMSSAVEEIKSRGAKVIVISNHEVNSDRVDYHIKLDSPSFDNTLLNLIYGVLLQKISYYMALIKGHNPDFPKNLAKVVTVDG